MMLNLILHNPPFRGMQKTPNSILGEIDKEVLIQALERESLLDKLLSCRLEMNSPIYLDKRSAYFLAR